MTLVASPGGGMGIPGRLKGTSPATGIGRTSLRRPTIVTIPHLESLISLAFPSSPNDDPASTESAVNRLTLDLREALGYAVIRADMGLLHWLMGLKGHGASILDNQAFVLTDVDGNRLTSIAIIASAGVNSSSAAGSGVMEGDDDDAQNRGMDILASGRKMEDREEVVRMVVRRWGILHGNAAWQPLHLAALLASPPLVSFLLTQGASPHATTLKGLTAYDLIMDMSVNHRQDVAALLYGAMQGEVEDGLIEQRVDDDPDVGLSVRRQRMLQRHRSNKVKQGERLARRNRRRRDAEERDMWVRANVQAMELGESVRFIMRPLDDVDEDEEDGGGGNDMFDEMEGEDTTTTTTTTTLPRISDVDDSSFLVWSLEQVATPTDIFVRSYPPQCFPLTKRSLPANAIYLYAKFALHRCDAMWLTTILEEMTLNIEQICVTRSGDLPYLAFWTHNVTILLHLIQSDVMMLEACENENLCLMLEEMLHALQVHVIRIAETKIDKILDIAMLDHETIETPHVRFEDEWAIFRGLASKRKTSAPSDSPAPSLGDGKYASIRRLTTMASPPSVVSILSATLLILQLYEINPALTIQVFSQIFLWMASEMFNRIIAQGKKYLCRSKAMQIKMNITALEDWVRRSFLPPAIFTCHFERLQQLLQWLQCSSQLHDFDMLIATMQTIQSLNPLQMRRAVKDYRYEVNEPRMSDECSQYLSQLQRDWERRRIRLGVEAIQRQVNMRKQGERVEEHAESDGGTAIDDLFDADKGLREYKPPIAPPSIGESEESRHMLPLFLPSNRFLPAIPHPGAASAVAVDDEKGDRPPHRALGWIARPGKTLREMPDDFILWLQAATEARRVRLGLEVSEVSLPTAKPRSSLIQHSSMANIRDGGRGGERSRVHSDPSSRSSRQDTYARMPSSAPPCSPSSRKSLGRSEEGACVNDTGSRWWKPAIALQQDG